MSDLSSTPIHVRSWVHPQLAAWAKEDKEAHKSVQAELDAYLTFMGGIAQLEDEREKYRYAHETLPAMERRPHEDRLAEMDRNIRENYAYARSQWPEHPEQRLAQSQREREARRAKEEQALRDQLRALTDWDSYLSDKVREADRLAALEAQLQAQLNRCRARHAEMTLTIEEAREEWQAAADQVGFPGQPSVDLQAGLHPAVLQDSFERAIA